MSSGLPIAPAFCIRGRGLLRTVGARLRSVAKGMLRQGQGMERFVHILEAAGTLARALWGGAAAMAGTCGPAAIERRAEGSGVAGGGPFEAAGRLVGRTTLEAPARCCGWGGLAARAGQAGDSDSSMARTHAARATPVRRACNGSTSTGDGGRREPAGAQSRPQRCPQPAARPQVDRRRCSKIWGARRLY